MELVNPGIGLIFWMALSFGLLLFILGKFVWPPIMRALHEREKSIELALHEAEKAREEMKQLMFTNEQMMLEAKNERDKLIGEARKIRESLIEEARVKAGEEASRMIENARERIHFEKMAAITDLKNQVGVISIQIAEKVLRKELSGNTAQEAFVNDLVKEIKLN